MRQNILNRKYKVVSKRDGSFNVLRNTKVIFHNLISKELATDLMSYEIDADRRYIARNVVSEAELEAIAVATSKLEGLIVRA